MADPTSKRAQRKGASRQRVVNRFLSLYDEPRYLEIGVFSGRTFDAAKAAFKVAVDPMFRFDHTDPTRDVPGIDYHQVTSDEYFGSIIDPGQQFDVIYLDGLHTFEQTLRDLINALHHLQPRGVIVIDDVRPPTYLASVRDRERYFQLREALGLSEREWMGDVYRVVMFIETFHQALTYRTVANNHGQAVVWRSRRATVPDRLVSDVAAWSFEDLKLDESVLRLAPLRAIVGEVSDSLGLGGAAGVDSQ
jgi:hypothetical protein